METLWGMVFAAILWPIIRTIIVVIAIALIIFFGIRALIRYITKKATEAIDYDKLAKKTADEIERRQKKQITKEG